MMHFHTVTRKGLLLEEEYKAIVSQEVCPIRHFSESTLLVDNVKTSISSRAAKHKIPQPFTECGKRVQREKKDKFRSEVVRIGSCT